MYTVYKINSIRETPITAATFLQACKILAQAILDSTCDSAYIINNNTGTIEKEFK